MLLSNFIKSGHIFQFHLQVRRKDWKGKVYLYTKSTKSTVRGVPQGFLRAEKAHQLWELSDLRQSHQAKHQNTERSLKVRFLCKSVSLQINIQWSYLFCCFVVVCSCSKISETEDKKTIFSCRTLFPVNFVVQETKNPSTKDAPLEQNAKLPLCT